MVEVKKMGLAKRWRADILQRNSAGTAPTVGAMHAMERATR